VPSHLSILLPTRKLDPKAYSAGFLPKLLTSRKMFGSTISFAILLLTIVIAVMASDQLDSRFFEDQSGQVDTSDYEPIIENSYFSTEQQKRARNVSPFVRFGKRGGMTRGLRNGPMTDPLIRFGKRAGSEKRLSAAPFVRFGRAAFRQSAPHIRFGK